MGLFPSVPQHHVLFRARAEWACNATPTLSRWVDQALMPNPFVMYWFGFPSVAGVLHIYLARASASEMDSAGPPGPVSGRSG
jgi:hypothetical protein